MDGFVVKVLDGKVFSFVISVDVMEKSAVSG